MVQLDARTWLEVLPAAECWRLLALSPIARIAVIGEDGPEIYPMNIAVDGESVVFRTDPGSKLANLSHDPRVAVEADGIDLDRRTGWSVVLIGRARELGGADLHEAHRLPLVTWAVGDKARWFRVEPVRLTGRAIGERASRGGTPGR